MFKTCGPAVDGTLFAFDFKLDVLLENEGEVKLRSVEACPVVGVITTESYVITISSFDFCKVVGANVSSVVGAIKNSGLVCVYGNEACKSLRDVLLSVTTLCLEDTVSVSCDVVVVSNTDVDSEIVSGFRLDLVVFIVLVVEVVSSVRNAVVGKTSGAVVSFKRYIVDNTIVSFAEETSENAHKI